MVLEYEKGFMDYKLYLDLQLIYPYFAVSVIITKMLKKIYP